jgi:uncharacterized protein (UPF0332 family)
MMDGRDFLSVAKGLLSAGTEAAWRSAVSRAYYAIFHVARELLEDLGFAVPRGDRAHGHLWLRLSNCGDPPVENAGRELSDLRRERNRADYDVNVPLSSSTAAALVRDAEQIMLALDGVVEPTRTQITDAMKIYERDVLQDITWHP